LSSTTKKVPTAISSGGWYQQPFEAVGGTNCRFKWWLEFFKGLKVF
jgi:hypothetical protein